MSCSARGREELQRREKGTSQSSRGASSDAPSPRRALVAMSTTPDHRLGRLAPRRRRAPVHFLFHASHGVLCPQRPRPDLSPRRRAVRRPVARAHTGHPLTPSAMLSEAVTLEWAGWACTRAVRVAKAGARSGPRPSLWDRDGVDREGVTKTMEWTQWETGTAASFDWPLPASAGAGGGSGGRLRGGLVGRANEGGDERAA